MGYASVVRIPQSRGCRRGLVTKRWEWESEWVRRLVLVVGLVASGFTLGGCTLTEYVLPGASGDVGSSSDGTVATGEAPTSGSGATGMSDSEGGCGAGMSLCGELCVDLQVAAEHCGTCGKVCEGDELCLGGECREVLVLDCTSCPCADQCPGSEQHVLEATSSGSESDSDSGGQDPQQGLCCELAAPMQVVCILGDPDDVVCPG